jgi:hypothetical protein
MESYFLGMAVSHAGNISLAFHLKGEREKKDADYYEKNTGRILIGGHLTDSDRWK